MNELTILQHEDFGRIRAEVKNGESWFVAKDVCKALDIKNVSDALTGLEMDEKGGIVITDAIGRNQEVRAVNESGIYALIFQSRKPEAKRFRKWVTSEVLPSIRKTGGYVLTAEAQQDYVDLRGVPYGYRDVSGYRVRVITYNDVDWHSVNDLHAGMGVRTGSGQAARQLNACGRQLAIKILVTGNTHPAWFASTTGVKLITAGSRGGKRHINLQLTIEDF